jgi:hypothetical protein
MAKSGCRMLTGDAEIFPELLAGRVESQPELPFSHHLPSAVL